MNKIQINSIEAVILFILYICAQDDVIAELRIYQGRLQTDAPTDPTYSLTKSPEDGKATFEIAELIQDIVDIKASPSCP